MAQAPGSGDVPVLATPRLLAHAESAAAAAVRPGLAPGLTSVGTSALIEHRRPSPIGAEVVVEAELTEVVDRRLAYRFVARHASSLRSADADDAVVGASTMERAVVDKERFVSRARSP